MRPPKRPPPMCDRPLIEKPPEPGPEAPATIAFKLRGNLLTLAIEFTRSAGRKGGQAPGEVRPSGPRPTGG